MISSSLFFKKTFLQEEESQTLDNSTISPWIKPMPINPQKSHRPSHSELKLSRKTKLATISSINVDSNLHPRQPTILPILQQPTLLNTRSKKSGKYYLSTPEVLVDNYMNWIKRKRGQSIRFSLIHKMDQQDDLHNYFPGGKSRIFSMIPPKEALEEQFCFNNPRREFVRSRQHSLKKDKTKTEALASEFGLLSRRPNLIHY